MRGQGPIFAFYFARFVAPFVLFAAVALYLWTINDFGACRACSA